MLKGKVIDDSLFHDVQYGCDDFVDAHAGGVQFDGVIGFAERVELPGHVVVVALLDVFQNFFVGLCFALFLKFLETALGPLFSGSGQEDLVLCVFEDVGADVAAVHDDALSLTHAALDLYEFGAYRRESGAF